MGAFLTAFYDGTNFRYAGKVGTGFTDKERKEWLRWAKDNEVEGPLSGIVWVPPVKVIEVGAERVHISEDKSFVFKGNKWSFGEELKTGKLIKGRFIRVRDDKTVTERNLRLEQIPNWKKSSWILKYLVKSGKFEEWFLKYASEPKHPDTVIIPKNEYYRNGLTELDIYNYYKKSASQILPYLKLYKVLIITRVDGIVVRRHSEDDMITIKTEEEFEQYNNGRNVEFHIVVGKETNLGWIDIDPHEVSFNRTKTITEQIFNALKKEYKNVWVKFSGNRGFHLMLEFSRVRDTDKVRSELKNFLAQFVNDELTLGIAKKGQIRLDVTTLHNLGSVRAPYSLSVKTGLISMPVRSIKTFRKEDAII